MKFLIIQLLITVLFLTYAFSHPRNHYHKPTCDISSNPGSLLIKPATGSCFNSGDKIPFTFIPGSDVPSSLDKVQLAITYDGTIVLKTNVALKPGKDKYSFTFTVPDNTTLPSPSDARYEIGFDDWKLTSGTFSINHPKFGLTIYEPKIKECYEAGQTVTIRWEDPFHKYQRIDITKIDIYNNVAQQWTNLVSKSIPVRHGQYDITLPKTLAKQNGYVFGILVKRNGKDEHYYSNPF
ncbi:414_t:CDS:2, partial [Gigaspora rosea]